MARKTPQDRVGHKIPTPEEIKALRDQLQSITQIARALGPALTKNERRRLSHPRKGSEASTDLVLKMAQQHKLTSRNYSTEGMQNDQTLVRTLEPAVKEAYLTWLALRDVYLQARSEHWDAFLHFYGALSHLAGSDAEADAELAPVVEFMSRPTSPEDQDTTDEDTEDALE